MRKLIVSFSSISVQKMWSTWITTNINKYINMRVQIFFLFEWYHKRKKNLLSICFYRLGLWWEICEYISLNSHVLKKLYITKLFCIKIQPRKWNKNVTISQKRKNFVSDPALVVFSEIIPSGVSLGCVIAFNI